MLFLSAVADGPRQRRAFGATPNRRRGRCLAYRRTYRATFDRY